MHGFRQPQVGKLPTIIHAAANVTLISGIALLVFTLMLAPGAQAQTFRVIHAFTGQDGFWPYGGVTLDRAGNLYGTTAGDFPDTGTVFQLRRTGGSWILTTIDLQENFPMGRVIFGRNGSLYGTAAGGSPPPFCEFGCGSVYEVTPPICTRCDWGEAELYGFAGGAGGANPGGDLAFDPAGNLYGTAGGGSLGNGVIFKLTPSSGAWIESVAYNFTGGDDGAGGGGLSSDSAGNIYGTTWTGGVYRQGSVFRLSPSGSGWVLTNLFSFQGGSEGTNPVGPLIFDRAGNLYGATTSGGLAGGGTVFELSPSGGSWTFKLLYSLRGGANGGPQSNLAMDASGNLYGAAISDGAFGAGSVFKLTPTSGVWAYTDLHDFNRAQINDGNNPNGGVSLDANGNLYGTTVYGGAWCGPQGATCGVVWEITP